MKTSVKRFAGLIVLLVVTMSFGAEQLGLAAEPAAGQESKQKKQEKSKGAKATGAATSVVGVLDETKVVDGVKTRIIEESETEGGKLSEISRNYFAIDKKTGDVYYFGEPKVGDQYYQELAPQVAMDRAKIDINYETKDGKVVKLAKPVTRYAAEYTKGDETAEAVVMPDGTSVEQ